MIAALSQNTVNLAYLVAAVCFVVGIRMLSSPRTARVGNVVSAAGMIVAIVFTLLLESVDRYAFVLAGIAIGATIGAVGARTVRMTAMPQMVALLNGAGGGAAAGVAIAEFDRLTRFGGTPPGETAAAIVTSTVLGGLTLAGSVVAFGKLQELIRGRPIVFPGQQVVNALVFSAAVALAVISAPAGETWLLGLAFVVAAVFGVLFVLPIGGADMPVVIALLNAFSGLGAVGAGFVLDNNALIIGGALVGASGTLLTLLMAKAMNRSVANVLFGAFGQIQTSLGERGEVEGTVRATTPHDVAVQLSYSRKVIIVPGYGMAVAQAQHDIGALADLLAEQGVDVKYAIHPVAGRMPGHMNVLLAEAQVPYSQLYEMERINPEFPQADVALVIGANDVTNPAANTDPASPIYGMPILEVDKAASVVVLKRSMNPGFSGIDNDLYLDPKTTMLFGDARESVLHLITAMKDQ